MKKSMMTICLVVVVCASNLMISGCQITGDPATDGAITGAGIGALAGQVLGGDTEGTLIGAGLGAGFGYLVGGQQKTQQQIDDLRAVSYTHLTLPTTPYV